ncbi:hypothetical protein C4D60_Mb10t16950 [Musa balbisiana]|uniref:ATP-dependent DNA helicase n=1 Tax=Musa balbisiana TaxID=52838 RepID=A0A4S8IXS3_MUSBA|nr:hypothetical protein C4D60_Mb10t16950 [Musa balbisiana]
MQIYFGYSQFRSHQKEVIEKILDGKDCLVVMATGTGKSLCYQIPPLVTRKTAIVMSLKERGIKAEYLGSTQTDKTVHSHAESGTYDVLYMTPEKACSLTSRFWANLLNMGICLLAVDEAHCISEWGHDFRKEYKQLNMLRGVLSDVPFVALTATATEKVRNDIICSLNMNETFIAVGSFDRQNLFYGVKSFNRSLSFVDELVQEVSKYINSAGSTIIYCTTVKDTEQIYESLQNVGIKAGIYHGQMGSSDREKTHRSFIKDELQILVATIAFGMGIDKPNVRCIIHYGCPKSLESYYQESGRCGRDGLPSVCWLYYSRSDFTKADFYCAEAHSESQRKAIMESFRAAEKYCFLATCRRKFLLQYFGETNNDDCGNCDNCTHARRQRDLSRECFLLLSCIRSCGGRWGINMPIDILRGSRSKKIVGNNFDTLPLHGLGKDYSSTWWKALAAQLIANGYLKENLVDVYRTVSISPMGLQFLSSASTFHHRPLVLALTSEMADEEEHGSQKNKLGDLQNPAVLACEGLSEAESKLFFMLLDIRLDLANRYGTAPYAICGDETIKRLAKLRPCNRARLANIDGINQHFVTRYGDEFLTSISKLSQELNLQTDYEGTAQTTSIRKVGANIEKRATPAKLEAWRLWQHDGLSFQKIAEIPRNSGPIKEQTVISYVLDAAREGRELNWSRFCKETGLTLEIVSQIHCAITSVGSRCKLKPIKEELPESVSYDNIKTCLTMDELGLSAEEIIGCNSVYEAPNKITESPLHCPMSTIASESAPTSPYHCETHLKQSRSDDALDLESSARKLPKICENTQHCTGDLVATENAVLEWVRDHDGVSLLDIVEHFKGSKEESVLDLLNHLEGEFVIFKRNDLYKVM